MDKRKRLPHRAIAVSLVALMMTAGGCARRSTKQQSVLATPSAGSVTRININTASKEQLKRLPGIGDALANRIIEHRQKYGAFRRPEHLILVRGISEEKFRAIHDLVTTE